MFGCGLPVNLARTVVKSIYIYMCVCEYECIERERERRGTVSRIRSLLHGHVQSPCIVNQEKLIDSYPRLIPLEFLFNIKRQ